MKPSYQSQRSAIWFVTDPQTAEQVAIILVFPDDVSVHFGGLQADGPSLFGPAANDFAADFSLKLEDGTVVELPKGRAPRPQPIAESTRPIMASDLSAAVAVDKRWASALLGKRE